MSGLLSKLKSMFSKVATPIGTPPYSEKAQSGEDLFEEPPDPKKLEEVGWAMMKAWDSGSDYIAPDRRTYFRYAVPLMDINDAVRVGEGASMTTTDGRRYMMDTYRVPNGPIRRIGYPM